MVAVRIAALALAFAIAGCSNVDNARVDKISRDLLMFKERVVYLAIDPAVDARAENIYRAGMSAIESREGGEARKHVRALGGMNETLRQRYSLRIVSEPDEDIGLIRVSKDDHNVRAHYLFLEAIAPEGWVVPLDVFDEETKRTRFVSKWAQRVTEDTFNRVAADKGGNQIVDNRTLGYKARGELKPKFDAGVLEGAITEW